MKRFIAMLTAAIMITAVILPASVMASFTDVNDNNRYKDAINTLATLSVIDGYEDGTFRPDGAITRAEFTKLIVFMLGFQDLTYTSYTFDDVEPTHWARDYIQTAYDRGIISGFEDETFRPEDPVTYAQALKMVVCTLGYEQFANARAATGDDWANKYIQEAGELGLQRNISGAGYYDNATRGLIAQMLYNALEITMYENNGYSWVKTDKTLLNDYLRVKELKGTLVGVDDNVTEECTYTLPDQHIDILTNAGDEILIDYSTYSGTKAELVKYLGGKIKLYYRQLTENDERKLVSIDKDSSKNSVIELDHDDLNSFSNGTLKYYDENAKSKSIKFKVNEMTVRYNGKNISATDTVTLNGEDYTREQALEQWLNTDTDNSIYGNVILTDNENDNTVDMVQIYDYEVMVALSTPTTSDYRITDKLVTGNSLILDPQSASYEYTITKNGAEIPITSIAANDIVLYAWSLDETLCTLLVSNKTVNGTVSSISSDGGSMTINGTSYDIGPRCASYILEKNNKELKAGVTGTFYIDEFNTAIFGTLQEAAVIPYGYITNAYSEDGKYWATVYAPDTNASEAVSYPLKSNVKINGSNVKAETAISRIREAAKHAGDESAYSKEIYGSDDKQPLNTTFAQPARISVANGEISQLIMLDTDDIMPQNEDKEKIIQCKALDRYTYSSNSFTTTADGKTAFSVNSSTVVIYVPQDRSERSKYARKSASSAFTTGEAYYLEAYDINASKIAGLIIVYGADGTLTKVKKDTDYSIVASLPENAYSSVRDENVQNFDVYAGTNTTRTWTTYSRDEFSDIAVGDVIQFAYDSDNLAQGRINNIRFADIAKVLDGEEYNGQLYNWEAEQTPSEDNNYQKYKFDYRFKKTGTSNDEIYTSSTFGDVPYSRAVMFNVSQVLTEENKIYVTKGGFNYEDGSYKLDDSEYEEFSITPSTKIIRMEEERDEISRYVADTTADLAISDLKDAKNYGTDCSKILICAQRGVAKLIVIYI